MTTTHSTHVEQMINFVNTVPLSIPDLSGLGLVGTASSTTESSLSSSNSNEGASISAGSIVSFVAGISGQYQQDVLDSTLFAQFAASAKHDRQKDTQNWYSTYLSTLGSLAWTVQGFDFQQYKVSGSSFKLDDVVLDIMKAAFTSDEYEIVKSSIKALEKLKDDDDRIKLFGHNSVSSNAGNFQIGAVTESNGAVAMHTLGAYFASNDSNTDFLFFHYNSSKTKIYKGVQSMTLNEGQYGNIRTLVQQRLGKNIKDFITSIPLSSH
jgi:hypothetical protein